jgi:alanyl-tRNA synthetase
MNRIAVFVGLAALGIASAAPAQDENNPQVLRTQNAELQSQLKAAQDRKNELGQENEKLQAQIVQQEKELESLRHDKAEFSERTFFLRTHYAAWQVFLRRYPEMMARWKYFMESPVTAPNPLPEIMDSDWPLSSRGG